MSTQLQLRKGNTAQTAVFTGAVAEVTVDTDKNIVVVHDGVTVGGHPSITVDTLNSANSFLQSNDAVTLLTSKNYTDSANTQLKSYVDTGISVQHSFSQASFDKANTNASAITVIQGVDNTQNTNITTVTNVAAAAYNQANTGTTLAQASFNAGNTTNAYAQASYSQANTSALAISTIQSVDNTQNTSIASVTNTAAAAYTKAQAAFNTANTKFNSAGGTISGDTVVTGNLTVSGTTLYANVTNVVVEDNVITLNSNVTGTPTQNAGIEVNRGSSTNTSLIWNESVTSWELTNDGTTFDKITTNSVLAANVSYLQGIENSQNAYSQAAFSQANTNASAITVIQSVDNTQNTNISSADAKAQAAFDSGNTTLVYAQAAYNKANTITLVGPITLTNNTYISDANTEVAATTANTIIDIYSITTYRTVKYLIQATNPSVGAVHATELLVTHNNFQVYTNEYGTITTGNSLFTLETSIDSSNVYLMITTTNANTNVQFAKTSLISMSILSGSSSGDMMSLSGIEDLSTETGSEDLNV